MIAYAEISKRFLKTHGLGRGSRVAPRFAAIADIMDDNVECLAPVVRGPDRCTSLEIEIEAKEKIRE